MCSTLPGSMQKFIFMSVLIWQHYSHYAPNQFSVRIMGKTNTFLGTQPTFTCRRQSCCLINQVNNITRQTRICAGANHYTQKHPSIKRWIWRLPKAPLFMWLMQRPITVNNSSKEHIYVALREMWYCRSRAVFTHAGTSEFVTFDHGCSGTEFSRPPRTGQPSGSSANHQKIKARYRFRGHAATEEYMRWWQRTSKSKKRRSQSSQRA